MAIDTLTYKFDVMREDPAEVTEGPDDGIYCHGLWLEGERRLHLFDTVWDKTNQNTTVVRLANGAQPNAHICSAGKGHGVGTARCETTVAHNNLLSQELLSQ